MDIDHNQLDQTTHVNASLKKEAEDIDQVKRQKLDPAEYWTM